MWFSFFVFCFFLLLLSAFLSEKEPTASLLYIVLHQPHGGREFLLRTYSSIAHLMLFAQERRTTYLDSFFFFFSFLTFRVDRAWAFITLLQYFSSFTLFFSVKAGCGSGSRPPDYTS